MRIPFRSRLEGAVNRIHGPIAPILLSALIAKSVTGVHAADSLFSDANWTSMNPGITGANGDVYAAAVDGQGNLYIGGNFTFVGGVFAKGIAKWDGTNWSTLGSGVDGYVATLAVSGSELYVGGEFATAGRVEASRIAKWNGTKWSGLGSGLDGYVSALALSGSNVYAGGWFTNAGGIAVNGVAKWDGMNWSALGSGVDGYLTALAAAGSDLYAGGYFTAAGGTPATNIAKWNGTRWLALGSGTDTAQVEVISLAVSGNNLYAGGNFPDTNHPCCNRPYVAKWDGSAWNEVSGGLSYLGYAGSVTALAVSGENLYAAIHIQDREAGVTIFLGVAKWDGDSWSTSDTIDYGMFSYVSTVAVSRAEVYVGGGFESGIAEWIGTNWASLGSGMNVGGYISTLATSASAVYAGGPFVYTSSGSPFATNLAKWDGIRWSALGLGIDGDVLALVVAGGDLYAARQSGSSSDISGSYIQKWDGTNWSACGGEITVDNQVNPGPWVVALAASGSDIYAGGGFTKVNGIGTTNIAKWDGANWSALGLGMNEAVLSLAVSGSNLYAGGRFTTAGGSGANRIAKWDGNNWSALGSGMNSGYDPRVSALAISGDDLYAGGFFINAADIPAMNIAKWDGSSWSALGSGMNAPVYALALFGRNLYAAGEFTIAGGHTVNHIAKWDGTNWSGLGSGVDMYVRALTISGRNVYVGGDFLTAGGKVSPYVARAYLPDLPMLSVLRLGPDAIVSWPSANTDEFILEQADTLATPATWVTSAALVNDDGVRKSVTVPVTNSAQSFRLRRP